MLYPEILKSRLRAVNSVNLICPTSKKTQFWSTLPNLVLHYFLQFRTETNMLTCSLQLRSFFNYICLQEVLRINHYMVTSHSISPKLVTPGFQWIYDLQLSSNCSDWSFSHNWSTQGLSGQDFPSLHEMRQELRGNLSFR